MEPEIARRYEGILLGGRWFAGVSAPLRAELLRAAELRSLRGGETLFSRGAPRCGLYAVLEGAIRISASSESGKEALLTMCEPPTWFGEIAVFDGEARTNDATADKDALVLHVSQAALDELLAREPRYWRELGLLLASKLRLLLGAFEDVALYPLPVRLARRLLWMADGYGERRAHTLRVIEAKQEQLAMMLATSRQTTNQLLKELEAQGAIRLAYGQLEIVDLAALRRAAQVE